MTLLDPPPADLVRKDAPGTNATRTIYHVLLRAPQTSEAMSIRRRDPTVCPSSHTALIDTKLLFSPISPKVDIALRAPLPLSRSAVGVLSAPPTALAQISSLRHGLLTQRVGFRQLLARPSRGKRAAINHLPQSLSVSLGKAGIEAEARLFSATGLRCQVAMCCCPFSAVSPQARGHQVHGRLDVGARNSRGWGGSHHMVLYGAIHDANTWTK